MSPAPAISPGTNFWSRSAKRWVRRRFAAFRPAGCGSKPRCWRRCAGLLAMAVRVAATEAITPSLAALWRQDIRIDCTAARAALALPAHITGRDDRRGRSGHDRVSEGGRQFMSNRRTVFLACPYGQVGGGMGSIMAYLASHASRTRQVVSISGGWNCAAADHIALSPFFLAVAVGRILLEADCAAGWRWSTSISRNVAASIARRCCWRATKLVGGRVLLHLHAAQIVQFHASMGGTGKALLRWMFRSADHCVVLGDVWRRWVIDTFGVRPNRISIIYNGVPATASKLRPPRPRRALPPAVRRQPAGAEGRQGPAARIRQPLDPGSATSS